MNKKITVILVLVMAMLTSCLFISCRDNNDSTVKKPHKEHTYVLVEEKCVEPTCTQEGKKVYKCSECNKEKVEKIKPLGHDYGEWEIVSEPDCKNDGVKKRVCSRCGKEDIEYINSLPHEYELVEGTDADCENPGYHKYRCKNCGEEYIVRDEAIGHIAADEGVLIKSPTCEEKGIMRYKCDLCGEYYDVELEPIGHDFEYTRTVEATCDSFGYKEYTCKRSGCNKKKYEVTEQRKPHQFDENGVCTVCHKHVTEAMPFTTRDDFDYSFVRRDDEFGYIVQAKDETRLHQLIISREFLNALMKNSIYSFSIQLGSPDNEYRSFGYKTKDMSNYSYFNNRKRGYENTERMITFAKNGVIDDKIVDEEGLVLDIIYLHFGNKELGQGVQEGKDRLNDYALKVRYQKSYNKDDPETWLKSDLEVKYANSEWTFTKNENLEGYVNVIFAPEYITALMDSGVKNVDFTIKGKANQAISASVFDKYSNNLSLTFNVELTENMKTEGLELTKLYIHDLYGSGWNPAEHANGFIIKIQENK